MAAVSIINEGLLNGVKRGSGLCESVASSRSRYYVTPAMRREQSEVCWHNGFREIIGSRATRDEATGDDDVKANKLRLISKSGLPSRRFAPRRFIARFPSNAAQRPGRNRLEERESKSLISSHRGNDHSLWMNVRTCKPQRSNSSCQVTTAESN